VTVLRRYVEQGPDSTLAGIVSTAHWDLKPADQESRCRHFVRSPQFTRLFPDIIGEDLRTTIDVNTSVRRGGPVGIFEMTLDSATTSSSYVFAGESFYNSHYVLTLFTPVQD
jgi:hypothetical protein